jgi:hypothetical protein
VEVGTGDGSTHIKPKKAEEVQVWVVVVLAVSAVEDGSAAGDVIVWDIVVVVLSSLHPKKKPGV